MQLARARIAAAIVLAWLVGMPGSAGAEPLDGLVTGQVTDGTLGAGAPVGEAVSLAVYGRSEQTLVDQKTTQVQPNGTYAFAGLSRDTNLVYLAFVRHGGVTYPAAQPFQLQDQPTKQADIEVFETTSNDDAIRFERLNLLVAAVQPGMLQLMQMGAVVNTGDRTFVTENPQDQALARGLQFSLPKGALGAVFQTGFRTEDVVPAAGGLQVTSPVTPGRHEFALAFQVPYSGASADLGVQVPYAVGTLNVYVPQDGPRLEAGQLSPQAATQMGGQTYAVYAAQNVARATMVSAQLRELPSVGGLNTSHEALIGLGVALVVLGGGLWLFGTRARRSVGRPRTALDLAEERLQLVVRLAALDERYAAGDVARNQYTAERERGKQRLMELTAMARRGPTKESAYPG